MARYLDIAKQVESRRRMEGRTEPQRTIVPTSQPALTIYRELADATPKAEALAVFPDWQALLIKSKVLDRSVWVVRNHLDGIALANETGHPTLMLDDVLRQKGRTAEEARTALLPVLIAAEQ